MTYTDEALHLGYWASKEERDGLIDGVMESLGIPRLDKDAQGPESKVKP